MLMNIFLYVLVTLALVATVANAQHIDLPLDSERVCAVQIDDYNDEQIESVCPIITPGQVIRIGLETALNDNVCVARYRNRGFETTTNVTFSGDPFFFGDQILEQSIITVRFNDEPSMTWSLETMPEYGGVLGDWIWTASFHTTATGIPAFAARQEGRVLLVSTMENVDGQWGDSPCFGHTLK